MSEVESKIEASDVSSSGALSNLRDTRIPLSFFSSADSTVDINPPEHLGGLFPRGYLSVVASRPGVGKTWLMLMKSRVISVDGYKVVILNGESGINLLAMRVLQMRFNSTENVVIYSMTESLPYGGLAFTDPKGWENVNFLVREERPDVIYVDSLVAFCDCDESDMIQMRGVFTRLSALASKFNCAIVLNHHLRKSQNGASSKTVTQDDIIGSSIIGRLACSMYTLTPADDLITVDCVKSWFKKPSRFSYGISQDVEGYVQIKSSRPSEVQGLRERLVSVMRYEMHYRDVPYICKMLGGASYRAVSYHLKNLVEEGVFLRKSENSDKGGRPYFVYMYSQAALDSQE